MFVIRYIWFALGSDLFSTIARENLAVATLQYMSDLARAFAGCKAISEG